jgi:hypothetical protein
MSVGNFSYLTGGTGDPADRLCILRHSDTKGGIFELRAPGAFSTASASGSLGLVWTDVSASTNERLGTIGGFGQRCGSWVLLSKLQVGGWMLTYKILERRKVFLP